MALLDRLKQKKTTAPKTDAAENVKPNTPAAKADAAVAAPAAAAPTTSWLQPHVSEKAARVADQGIYTFDVPLAANKVEIAKAVEAQYKVNVVKVRTVRGIGKVVRRAAGRAGRRSNWKKALVELKKGQTLSLTEGV